MTKRYTLLLGLILVQYTLFCQPVITNIGPVIDDQFYYGIFIECPDEGDAGADVVWDFEDFNDTFYTLVNYVNLPVELEGYEDYPDCTSGWIVDLIVSEPFNAFFDFENDSWIEYGSYADVFNIVTQRTYSDALIKYSAPLNYGDSGNDTYEGDLSVDLINGSITGTYTYEVDAYGSITLPTSNFPPASYSDAIRIAYTQNESETINGVTMINHTSGYEWYIDQYPVPIAFSVHSVDLLSNLDTLEATDYFYRLYGYNMVILDIEENQKEHPISLFPNPASDYIKVQFDSKEIANLRILSVDGQIMKSLSILSNATIDISLLNPGFYISELSIDGAYYSSTPFIISN